MGRPCGPDEVVGVAGVDGEVERLDELLGAQVFLDEPDEEQGDAVAVYRKPAQGVGVVDLVGIDGRPAGLAGRCEPLIPVFHFELIEQLRAEEASAADGVRQLGGGPFAVSPADTGVYVVMVEVSGLVGVVKVQVDPGVIGSEPLGLAASRGTIR